MVAKGLPELIADIRDAARDVGSYESVSREQLEGWANTLTALPEAANEQAPPQDDSILDVKLWIHEWCQRHGYPGGTAAIGVDGAKELLRCDRLARIDSGRTMTLDEAAAVASPPATTLCGNGHVWSNHFGDDWSPDDGALCDCGTKRWHTVLAASPPATTGTTPGAIMGCDAGEPVAASPPETAPARSDEAMERRLLELAFGFHVSIEGEYGCPGATCPGVQRLVERMRALKGIGQRYDQRAAHGSRPAGTKEDI